jgi:hypothetical protein
MSSSRSHIPFAHKIDVYSRVSTRNDMGQENASWNLQTENQYCSYVPSASSTAIRTSPTIEEADYFTIFFPHDANISYTTRLKNLRVAVGGESIDSRWLQIMQIDKHVGFSGRIQHIQVRVKTVIE